MKAHDERDLKMPAIAKHHHRAVRIGLALLLALLAAAPVCARASADESRPEDRHRRTVQPQPAPWAEVVDFLNADRTNRKAFSLGSYVCIDFAHEVVHNARMAGLDAWVVAVRWQDSDIGHAFVAFNTTDRGLRYVEPQADVRYYAPVVGETLRTYWGPNPWYRDGLVIRSILTCEGRDGTADNWQLCTY